MKLNNREKSSLGGLLAAGGAAILMLIWYHLPLNNDLQTLGWVVSSGSLVTLLRWAFRGENPLKGIIGTIIGSVGSYAMLAFLPNNLSYPLLLVIIVAAIIWEIIARKHATN